MTRKIWKLVTQKLTINDLELDQLLKYVIVLLEKFMKEKKRVKKQVIMVVFWNFLI